MQTIHEKQLEDADLLASVARYPDRYFTKTLSEQDIICYSTSTANRDTQFKIALPTSMLAQTIEWFHIVTGHPGEKKLCMTIQQR